MTCTQIQTLLDTYADHALPAWQAFRVRRHLAGCAACTAQLADTRRLTAAVRAWHNVPAPVGLASQIAAALPPPAAAPTPTRNRRIARRTAIGLAGIAAATAAGFWLLPGHPAQPTFAYADVEEAMQQVQTVSWDFTIQPENNSNIRRIKVSKWLRRNPPAIADINYRSLSPNFDQKVLYDARGRFFLNKAGKCDVMLLLQNPIKEMIKNTLTGFTALPQSATAAAFGGTVLTTVTNFRQSSVVLAGKVQVLFDRDIMTQWSKPGTGLPAYRLAHVTTWVDPKTRRVTRIESHILTDTRMGKHPPKYAEVEDNFRYNQVPPPGVFDWSPPPGAKILSGPKALEAMLYFDRHPAGSGQKKKR